MPEIPRRYYSIISLEGVKKIIEEITPLIYDKQKKWLDSGYKICLEMMRNKKNTLLSELYAISYYVNGFKEEHFQITIAESLFTHLYKFQYPRFLTNYDGKILYVDYSERKDIPEGTIIEKINDMDWILYLEKYMNFTSGLFNWLDERIVAAQKIFVDTGNPYLNRPYKIKVNTGKVIYLNKYYPFSKPSIPVVKSRLRDDIFKFYKHDNKLYIRIPTFGVEINFKKMKELLPVKAIILDIRDNYGGSLDNVENFFNYLFKVKISSGFVIKNSIIQKYISSSNSRVETNQYSLCRKSSLPDIKKVANPHLTIIYNKNSLSICRVLIKLASLYVKNLKLVGGKISLENFYGGVISIRGHGYILNLPTTCFCFDKCPKK